MQTVISEVPRFESWRAHHPHRVHIVMSLGSRDHSPLVCPVAGGMDGEFRGGVRRGAANGDMGRVSGMGTWESGT
jgi:hypothetical protein